MIEPHPLESAWIERTLRPFRRFDRQQLATGDVDPAAAPLWIPGQRIDEGYARPQWRLVVGL